MSGSTLGSSPSWLAQEYRSCILAGTRVQHRRRRRCNTQVVRSLWARGSQYTGVCRVVSRRRLLGCWQVASGAQCIARQKRLDDALDGKLLKRDADRDEAIGVTALVGVDCQAQAPEHLADLLVGVERTTKLAQCDTQCR
eukprot:7391469-Prymnesium_polylepis.2